MYESYSAATDYPLLPICTLITEFFDNTTKASAVDKEPTITMRQATEMGEQGQLTWKGESGDCLRGPETAQGWSPLVDQANSADYPTQPQQGLSLHK